MQIICEQSDIKITPEALKLIAVLAEGALRDGISILERCNENEGEITESTIRELAGIPEHIYINKLTKNILEYETEKSLETLEEILAQGKDILNLIWEIIKYLRDILICSTSGKLELYNEEEMENIKSLSKITDKSRLLELIKQFSELENNIKWSSQQAILVQVAIIKASSKIDGNVIKKMDDVVIKNDNVGAAAHSRPNNKMCNTSPDNEICNSRSNDEMHNVQQGTCGQVPVQKKQQSATEEDSNEYLPYWKDVIDTLKKTGKVMIYTNLINTRAKELNDAVIGIEFLNGISSFGKSVIEKPENMQELKKIILKFAGKEMHIKIIENKSVGVGVPDDPNIVQKQNIEDLGIPINIIE